MVKMEIKVNGNKISVLLPFLKFNLTIIILKLPLQPNPWQFSVILPFEKQASWN